MSGNKLEVFNFYFVVLKHLTTDHIDIILRYDMESIDTTTPYVLPVIHKLFFKFMKQNGTGQLTILFVITFHDQCENLSHKSRLHIVVLVFKQLDKE